MSDEPKSPSSTPAQSRPRSKLVRFLKALALLFAAAVVLFVVVGMFFLDGKFDVSRETTINAPPDAVHEHVGDLRQWPNWLPFVKQDPSVKTTIEQPTGVGAHQHWTSDQGNGELTITSSDPQQGIEFDMLFDKKFASKGSLKYAPAGDGTRVTWRMTGQNDDFVSKWMSLLMPAMVGPAFETGLSDLKQIVESSKAD